MNCTMHASQEVGQSMQRWRTGVARISAGVTPGIIDPLFVVNEYPGQALSKRQDQQPRVQQPAIDEPICNG